MWRSAGIGRPGGSQHFEEGEKASVAQLFPGVIITHINGEPVTEVEDYAERMTAIEQGAAEGKAVLTLFWMGKGHVVPIEFR